MESGHIFFNPSCNSNMLFLGNGDSVFGGMRPAMNLEEGSKKRPFFSTAEELYDDEYYDEQLTEKKRRLSPDQVHLLEKSFEEENKLEPDRKTQLAKKLGLQPRQVAVWFQNRRARWKTKQLERDYDVLKSAYDSLQANYDSVLKENNKFKAELESLTEKLQPKELEPMLWIQKSDVSVADVHPCLELAVKVEDPLSGDGSDVVDDDGPQLIDSGESYYPNGAYPVECLAEFEVANNSEEDDGSHDGGRYFTNVFSVAGQQEPTGWFMWS